MRYPIVVRCDRSFIILWGDLMERTKPINEGSFEASRERRAQLRTWIASGFWRPAEPDAPRTAAYDRARRTTTSAKAIAGDKNDLEQVTLLLKGEWSRMRRAVTCLESNDARESRTGTGFLISDRLFPTHKHVIPDVHAARARRSP